MSNSAPKPVGVLRRRLSSSTNAVVTRIRSMSSSDPAVPKNTALERILSRFEFYAVSSNTNSRSATERPYLTRARVRQMLLDVQGKKSLKLLDATMNALDTHHTGQIHYDEFVSFVSWGPEELASIAIRLRRKLKNSANSSLYNCFALVSDTKSHNVIPEKLLALIDHKLDIQLTPGEAHWIAHKIGPSLRIFKRYLKSDVSTLIESWTSDHEWLTDIAISFSAKEDEIRKEQGFEPVPLIQTGQTSLRVGLPRFWMRRTSRNSAHDGNVLSKTQRRIRVNRATGDEGSVDSAASDSAGSDDDASEQDSEHADSADSSASEDDEDDSEEEDSSENEKRRNRKDAQSNSKRSRSRSRLESKSARGGSPTKRVLHHGSIGVAPLSQLEIAEGKTDAGLVADGYVCLETPLDNRKIRLAKAPYLWMRREAVRFDTVSEPDAILEVAVTLGNASKRTSPVWTPPCRGFKRLCFNFATAAKALEATKHGSEAFTGIWTHDYFLWYRKADSTYTREQLASWRHKGLAQHGWRDEQQQPHGQALQTRLRERTRSQVAEIRKSAGKYFDPVDILDQVAPNTDRLRKKAFVQGLHKLGIQLSAHDLAAIFDSLDVYGNNYVLREDVVDFFELSDKELENILIQIQAFMRHSKREGETLLRIFKNLDTRGNGRLTARDIHKLLCKMGILASIAEAQRLIDRIDTNENGVVEMEEFVDFVHRGDLSNRSSDITIVSSNVRAAARKLHEIAIQQAQLGTNTGRLSHSLDTEFVWLRLLGQQADRLSGRALRRKILDPHRLRQILHKKGLRLRKEEVITLVESLEPDFDRLKGLGFKSFDRFVRHVQPTDEAEVSKKDEKVEETALVVSQEQGKRQSRLAHVIEDLNTILLNQGTSAPDMFDRLFSEELGRKAKRVKNHVFIMGLERIGALARLPSTGDRDRLLSLLDQNRDGYISKIDFTKFVQNVLDEDEASTSQALILRSPTRNDAQSIDSSDSHSLDSDGESSSDEDEHANAPSSPRKRKKHDESHWWLSLEGKSTKAHAAKSPRSQRSPKSSLQKAENEEDQAFVSNLMANDVRQSWLLHLDSINAFSALSQVDQAQVIQQKRNTNSRDGKSSATVLNLYLVQSAVEAAAREHGGPLQLLKRFRKQDKSGRGYLSKSAFNKVLSSVHLEIPKSEHKALQTLLKDSKGKVDYSLFCDIVQKSSEIKGINVDGVHRRLGKLFEHCQDVRSIFESFDRKGEGKILQNEFDQALMLCSVAIPKYDWSVLQPQLVREGKVDYMQFCELLETSDLAHPLSMHKNRKPDEVRFFKALVEHRGALTHASDSDLREIFEPYDEDGHGVIACADAFIAIESLVSKSDLKNFVPRELIRSIVARYANADRFDYLAFSEAFENSAVHLQDQGDFLRRLSNDISRSTKILNLSFLKVMEAQDVQGYGKMSRYTFRRCLRQDLGIKISERELAFLMDIAETQGDGNVDYIFLNEKLALHTNALPSAESLARHRELVELLQQSIDHARQNDSFFDLRTRFHSFTSGKDIASGPQLGRFVASFSLFASTEDLRVLAPGGALSFNALSKLLEIDESEWDIIAVRCKRRMNDLERQGKYFTQECFLYDECASEVTKLSHASSGISRRAFVKVCKDLGLPISLEQLDMILRRFQNKENGLVTYQAFIDFVCTRARLCDITTSF